MACPAEPSAGLSEAMTGGPPAVATTVLEVVVDVVVCPALGAVVDGDARVPGEPAAVGDGGEELPVIETTNAMRAATTRAAATATAPASQRSVRRGGRTSPSRGGVGA
jgi:hypothetical protein